MFTWAMENLFYFLVFLLSLTRCRGLAMTPDDLYCSKECQSLENERSLFEQCMFGCLQSRAGTNNGNFYVEDEREPEPPTEFTAEHVTSNSVELVWRPPYGDITNYFINYNGSTTETLVDDGFATSQIIENLQPETIYRFSIVACNSVGCSPEDVLLQKTHPSSTAKMENKIDYPDPPSNLQLSFETEVRNRRKVIRGTVSWTPPKNTQHLINYDLRIQSDDDCLHPMMLHKYDNELSKNSSSYLIPHDESINKQSIIYFGCQYHVTLMSVPYPYSKNSDSYQATLDVKVPDCVSGFCGCPEKGLGAPANLSIEVKLQCKSGSDDSNNDTSVAVDNSYSNVIAFVSWRYESNFTKPVQFEILLGEFIILQQKDRKLYKFGEPIYMPQNESEFYEHRIENLAVQEWYKILIKAVDSDFCESQHATEEFYTENLCVAALANGSTYSEHTALALKIAIPILIFLASILLVLLYMCRKYQKRHQHHCHHNRYDKKHNIPHDTSNYSGNTEGTLLSGLGSPISVNNLELNVLYVEQEIEDAIADGRADSNEFSYARLKFEQVIGEGAFGQVYVGTAYAIGGVPGETVVAIKKLRNRATEAEKHDFLSEISMMKHVGQHKNIVTMLGCVTIQEPYCMIMEYVPYGDLLKYLRNLRRTYEKKTGRRIATHKAEAVSPMNSPLSDCCPASTPAAANITASTLLTSSSSDDTDLITFSGGTEPSEKTKKRHLEEFGDIECVLDAQELQCFALQIAEGMEHLSSKGVTHRDLAARNVLVGANKTLKISDFGLSREGIYVKTSGGRIPLRWLSVEAMRDNVYTSQSDVWAFGMVLWEICTLGGFPYPTVSDRDLLSFLLRGNRLEKPHNCNEQIYEIMLSCWEHDPIKRPTFTKLCHVLEALNKAGHTYVNVDPRSPTKLPPITGKYQELLFNNPNIEHEVV